MAKMSHEAPSSSARTSELENDADAGRQSDAEERGGTDVGVECGSEEGIQPTGPGGKLASRSRRVGPLKRALPIPLKRAQTPQASEGGDEKQTTTRGKEAGVQGGCVSFDTTRDSRVYARTHEDTTKLQAGQRILFVAERLRRVDASGTDRVATDRYEGTGEGHDADDNERPRSE